MEFKSVVSEFFPSRLSTSDIELLIRCPYSFYAKKILNLRLEDSLIKDPTLGDFGKFLHSVLADYSITYTYNNNNKIKSIIDIGIKYIKKKHLPEFIKKIWQKKLEAIANEYIIFDEKRRISKRVYSEIKGSMIMSIDNTDIQIVSVADRIEVSNDGGVCILDYKTGVVPNIRDIENGFSPQLIIEALIAINGGFKVNEIYIESLTYIKINSKSPYIRTFNIPFTYEKLKKNLLKIKALLKYYLINKKFSLEIDLLKYNAYKHLSRKL